MLQKKESIAQRIRLPSICVLCQLYHRGHFAVCSDCNQHFTPLGPACSYCALPLPDEQFLVCGICCKERPHFDQAVAAYRFEGPLRALLHDFKYYDALYLRSFLAQLMLESVPPHISKTQYLLPVPMHFKKLRQRGFNQAAELAKYLGKALNIPCALSLCKKIINTVPQAELNGKERQKNLSGAFLAEPCSFDHVTLIDDLLTTGSTANELARVLKKQGVKQVDVWCLARVGNDVSQG